MRETRMAGFFTLGVPPERYTLPHPSLGLPVILFIRRVLMRAFEKLRERGFSLATEREDRVTEQLFNVLENDLRQTGEIKGFNSTFYDRVVRHAEVTNYNGQKLAKTPDLSFKFRHADVESRSVVSSHDALFVECKPVDAGHAAGSAYCDDGLIRFVNGDYAWAMQEGMMLAYARDGRTIAKHLIPAMSASARNTSLGTVQSLQICPELATAACPEAEAVHVSQHRRNFPWPDGKGRATNITVYHLWHRCS
jgi:hypothetical protein